MNLESRQSTSIGGSVTDLETRDREYICIKLCGIPEFRSFKNTEQFWNFGP